jgi:signal transduction histidine kinase
MDVRVAAAAQEHALELHPVRTDAARLALAAHATAAPRYAAKGVALGLDVSDEPMSLRCDAERVHQVLANLLDNALRHTPSGGSVRLSARRAGTDALLIVEDSGEGLAAGQLQRIFERFYRVDSSRSAFDGSGSGLGLTIAQAIVAGHGGTITAYSDGLGKGSRFTIALPLDLAGS